MKHVANLGYYIVKKFMIYESTGHLVLLEQGNLKL